MVTMKRNARLETRMRPEDKRIIEAAAAVEGLSVSDFVLVAVKHRALDILEQYRRIKLSDEVSRQFTEILMDQTSHPPRSVAGGYATS